MSPPYPTTGLPVTGEAVALDLRVARLPSRTLGLLIDLCVQIPLLFAVMILVGWVGSSADGALTAALLVAALVAVLVGYPVLVETLSHGRSLGKLAMGLRVVRDDGGPARFRHALVRGLFLIFELWITSGTVGLITSLLSTQGKRLGDHFAGTVVVNERVVRAAAIPGALVVPRGLEPWAASLDLSGLPDSTAAQAQQLLGRWGQLSPQPRDRLAQALADEVAARVSPPPPPGVPAAAYLTAVVAERSRRAYAGALPWGPYAATRPTAPVGPGPVPPRDAGPAPTPAPGPPPVSPPDDSPFRLPY